MDVSFSNHNYRELYSTPKGISILSIYALVFVASCFFSFVLVTSSARAWTYLGVKWNPATTAVQVDISWPSAWITPLANSMSTWNSASSPFSYTVGSSGHRAYAQARGTGYPMGETYISGYGGYITDADFVLNTSYSWSTTTPANPTPWDVQSVATHELGHFLGLGHSTSATATMYSIGVIGTISMRSLESDDLSGINNIYP